MFKFPREKLSTKDVSEFYIKMPIFHSDKGKFINDEVMWNILLSNNF